MRWEVRCWLKRARWAVENSEGSQEEVDLVLGGEGFHSQGVQSRGPGGRET